MTHYSKNAKKIAIKQHGSINKNEGEKMQTRKIMVVFVAVVITAMAITGVASAESVVHGYVSHQNTFVPGATVTLYDNADLSGIPLAQNTTDGNGYYEIAFDGTITEPPYVLAEKNGLTGSGQSELKPSLSSSTSRYYKDLTIYKAVETPEFATIAIPVASILGLLFLFNHRKSRKE